MKVVIDTNVIVSGLLTPFGNSAEIVRMITSGKLNLCFDARILTEYEEVLKRPKFKFEINPILLLLEQIEHCGITVASSPLYHSLPDPDDDPFLEAAIAADAECVITGNSNHYPVKLCQGVKVYSPKEFLRLYRKINS